MSGSLAGYYSSAHEAAYFGSLGVALILIGAIVGALSPMIQRLMAGVR
jgi:POT family proton-dependent oligopeptide transporter